MSEVNNRLSEIDHINNNPNVRGSGNNDWIRIISIIMALSGVLVMGVFALKLIGAKWNTQSHRKSEKLERYRENKQSVFSLIDEIKNIPRDENNNTNEKEKVRQIARNKFDNYVRKFLKKNDPSLQDEIRVLEFVEKYRLAYCRERLGLEINNTKGMKMCSSSEYFYNLNILNAEIHEQADKAGIWKP